MQITEVKKEISNRIDKLGQQVKEFSNFQTNALSDMKVFHQEIVWCTVFVECFKNFFSRLMIKNIAYISVKYSTFSTLLSFLEQKTCPGFKTDLEEWNQHWQDTTMEAVNDALDDFHGEINEARDTAHNLSALLTVQAEAATETISK